MCFSFSWLRFWLKIFSILKLMLKRFQWLTIKNGGQAAYLSDVTWIVLFLTFLISLMYVNAGTELHIANFVFKDDMLLKSWFFSFRLKAPRRGSLSDVDILTGRQGNVDILNSVQEDDVPSLTITPDTPQKNGQPRTRSNTDSEGFFEEV